MRGCRIWKFIRFRVPRKNNHAHNTQINIKKKDVEWSTTLEEVGKLKCFTWYYKRFFKSQAHTWPGEASRIYPDQNIVSLDAPPHIRYLYYIISSCILLTRRYSGVGKVMWCLQLIKGGQLKWQIDNPGTRTRSPGGGHRIRCRDWYQKFQLGYRLPAERKHAENAGKGLFMSSRVGSNDDDNNNTWIYFAYWNIIQNIRVDYGTTNKQTLWITSC